MSFIISNSNNEYIGIFLHVPKIAGTSFQSYLKKCGFFLLRPNPNWIGHLSAKETVALITASSIIRNSLPDIIPLYALWREPSDWMNSLWSYAQEEDPKVSGFIFEKEYFSRHSIDEYYKDFIKFHCLSNSSYKKWNYNKLALRKLSEYYDLDNSTMPKTSLNIYSINNINQAVQDIANMNSEQSCRISSFSSDYILNSSSNNKKARPINPLLANVARDIHAGSLNHIFEEINRQGKYIS